MKITIYELLGMIKDGKIPKKIKYINDIWEYIEKKENYIKSNGASLNWDYVALYCLKEPVEILEEEKKTPEKLETEHEFYSYVRYEENKNEIDKVLYILKAINLAEEKIGHLNNSVNEIIDYLKSKGE